MVAAIDGHAQAEELKKLREMLTYTGVKPELAEGLYDEALAHREDPLWFLTPGQVSKSFATLCLRDASIMAFADHEVHETERALLYALREALGYPDHDIMLPEDTTATLASAAFATASGPGGRSYGAAPVAMRPIAGAIYALFEREFGSTPLCS